MFGSRGLVWPGNHYYFFKSCFAFELLGFFIWNRLDLFLALFGSCEICFLRNSCALLPDSSNSPHTGSLNQIDYANANHVHSLQYGWGIS